MAMSHCFPDSLNVQTVAVPGRPACRLSGERHSMMQDNHHPGFRFTTGSPVLRPVLLCLATLLACCTSAAVRADDSQATRPERPNVKAGLPGETFEVAGRSAFVLLPEKSLRRTPQPWIMYAPTLPADPDRHERWMHEQFLAAGIAVAGVDAGEAYGSPAWQKLCDGLYDELTGQRQFASRVCLLGRSRGGLWMTSWAGKNTAKVAGMAGIYPVFDLTTYPGLKRAAPAYGLTVEQLQEQLAELNPVEQAGRLAEAGIPIYLIHGDVDTVVPLEANSAEVARRYAAAGRQKLITVNVVEGEGHNYFEGFFRCQPLVDFAIARARAGAAKLDDRQSESSGE